MKLHTLFLIILVGQPLFAQAPFIITINLENLGTPASTSFTIPTTGGGYNYDVDWYGDGTYDEFGLTGNATHDYGASGTYTIRINGDFPRIYFNNNDDRQKLIDIKQWGDIAWTSMENAFWGCTFLHISAVDLPDLDSVTSMASMFRTCISLNGPANINSWNTEHVTDLSYLFYNVFGFNRDIGGWNTRNVTDMSYLFYRANAFNQDIGGWNTQNVANMSRMFDDAAAFNQDIGGWDTRNVTNMSYLFSRATAFNQDIGGWNTENVTDMSGMFSHATAFNQDISGWNTRNVTNMSGIFSNAAVFNQDISGWNILSVTDMSFMFSGTTAFNQDIGGWNTRNVTNMSGMFGGPTAFNQDIGGWNTENVTNMSFMFASTTTFNQDIGGWNTQNVTDMSQMFYRAAAFNQDIGNWNTRNVTKMTEMFYATTAFNQDIGNWSTHNVIDISGMFANATAFNQDIGDWTLNTDVAMFHMLDNCGMDCVNYSATLIGWRNNPATPDNRSLGASHRQYGTNAQAARDQLTGPKGWTITGDGPSGTLCAPTDTHTPASRVIYLQASPNPAVDGTELSFDLPMAGYVQLLLFDASGRLVSRYSATLPAGAHRRRIELPAPGTYSVQLVAKYGVKMVRVIGVR